VSHVCNSYMHGFEEEAMIYLNPTKIQVEISGFIIFLLSYLLFFNLFFHFRGSELPIYAPGTLIFAFTGYWLGGYLYDKYLK
jgi:uncharacterized membrane protein YfcA